MPSRDKTNKVKSVVWSSGRGGAGNISKNKNGPRRVIVDPDIRPQKKMLELETARNRSTAGGRGGRGNRYDHVLEPGLFERVLQYESARIVATKAEMEANKTIKIDAPRARSKSILSGDDVTSSLHSNRARMRLRSASTSTLATSISGSSTSPSNASSSARNSHPSTRASSVASKLFSPWKKRMFSGTAADRASTSTDDTSLRSMTPNWSGSIAIPSRYSERSSSLYALPTTTTIASSSNPKASGSIVSTSHESSTSFGSRPHTPSSCSPPRLPPVRPARLDLPRGFTLASSGDRVPIYYDREYLPVPRSFSSVDVSATASSQNDRFDAYPFLVESGIPDHQEQPFTAYHLPLRPNIVRHNPMRRCEGVPFI